MNPLLIMVQLWAAGTLGHGQAEAPKPLANQQQQVFLHGIPDHQATKTPHRLKAPTNPEQLQKQLRDQHPMAKTSAAKMEPCEDMNLMAQAAASPSQLADYLVNLPNVTCTYPLFSIDASQAAVIYTPANVSGIADRITQLAPSYNGSGRAIGNLVLLPAGGIFQRAWSQYRHRIRDDRT